MEAKKISIEINKPVEFSQVKTLWNQAFGKDLEIVGHPETQKRTPFNGVNPDDSHGRQYNLTEIPDSMTEDQFLFNFYRCDTIYISCMDKDASGPGYKKLTKDNRNVMLISMAGGIIQFSEDRQQALETMLKYLSQHNVLNQINTVIATDHDNTCGYIKVKGLGGTSLSDKLKSSEEEKPAETKVKENKTTKQMIKYYANKVNILKYFSFTKLGLAKIDRQGGIEFEDIDDHVQPKSLEEITS